MLGEDPCCCPLCTHAMTRTREYTHEQLHTYTQNCFWNVFLIFPGFAVSAKFYICSKAAASKLEDAMFLGKFWCYKFEFFLIFLICHSKDLRCYILPHTPKKFLYEMLMFVFMEQPWMRKSPSPANHKNAWWLLLKSNQF